MNKSNELEAAREKAYTDLLEDWDALHIDHEPNKHDFMAGFDAGYEAGKADGIPQGTLDGYAWRPIHEEPEDDGGYYLVTWKAYNCGPFVTVGEFLSDGGGDEAVWIVDVRNDAEYLAWMPLPSPYEPK